MLADEAMAMALVPWACPCDFGPERRYRLEELIAYGRRSFVYRARDSRLSSTGFDAQVVIKITPPLAYVAPTGDQPGQSGRSGLENDALSTRRVTHPNVLRVIDHGEDESGAIYLVSEYVDGGSLAERVVPWAPRDAARFMATLSRAVQAAHMAGVIHCDLKPSNILLTRDGEPKLADFDLSFSPVNQDETHRGNLAFMSPEQFHQEENALTPSADVYGLGGLLHWLLSGTLPHGSTPDEIVAFHRAQRQVPRAAVENDLARICSRALERRRADRYGSAQALADDLERWLSLQPIEWTKPGTLKRTGLLVRRHPVRTGFLVAALAVGAAGSYVAYDKTVGARQRELATQVEINTKTQQELEVVRNRLKMIMRISAAAIGGGGQGSAERVLPSLFWLEYLRGEIVVNAKGEVELPAQRIDGLEKLIADAEAQGTAEQTDMRIARYALAGYLVDAGRGPEALRHVEWMESHWVPNLNSNDVVVLGVGALRECAQAQIEALSQPGNTQTIQRLQRLRERLVQDGRSASMVGIVERVIKHLTITTNEDATVHLP
ncbi:MAG: serine/threonine-protein kinase [Phycisphaerales bacterium]